MQGIDTETPHARVRTGHYEIVLAVFCSLLLISNISAVKLIEFGLGPWHIITDGGAFLFPLTYILGDVLAEVFGYLVGQLMNACWWRSSD